MEVNNVSSNQKEAGVSFLKEILQWLEAIVISIIIALLIRAFIFEPVEVQGQSMENTLYNNERLILYKLGYLFSEPKKGDIVVLQVQEGFFKYIPFIENLPFIKKINPFPQEIDYIKRVIGLPGDKIEIKGGHVFVNDEKLDENYTKGLTMERPFGSSGITSYPVIVPEGKVFVLGDNRENSSDSRTIGFIDIKKIKGKAVFRFWPLNRFGKL